MRVPSRRRALRRHRTRRLITVRGLNPLHDDDGSPCISRAGTLDPAVDKANMATALSHLARWDEAKALWQEVINNGAPKEAMNSQLKWANACKAHGQWQQAVLH